MIIIDPEICPKEIKEKKRDILITKKPFFFNTLVQYIRVAVIWVQQQIIILEQH